MPSRDTSVQAAPLSWLSKLVGGYLLFWGKAAYETRGLGRTIVAHFLIDLAIMAAYFVPR